MDEGGVSGGGAPIDGKGGAIGISFARGGRMIMASEDGRPSRPADEESRSPPGS